jgi:preprotein translocase subunit SecB
MAEDNNPQDTATDEAPKGAQFALQRVYLKDLSFESPMGLMVLQKQWQPKIEQDLNTSVNKLSDTSYEVVLKLTVNATVEDKTAFLVEVQQAGLFQISGLEGPQLAHVFNTMCAQILFPYAREAIDSVVVKGGFPALNLPPINFDALFAQAVREARTNAEASGAGAPASAE